MYARRGVAENCLKLQDDHAADITIVLYLLWLAAQNRQLAKVEISQIVDATNSWRENVVKPLRTVRRHLKRAPLKRQLTATQSLRSELKKLELNSEKIQLQCLFENAQKRMPGIYVDNVKAACSVNLRTYGQISSNQFEDADVRSLLSAI